MLKLDRVAVTGGLASGKSAVCKVFRDLGAYVISADEIVHRLLSPATPLGQQIINLIGPEVVVNHQIDRSKIANKVFTNPNLLKKLEALLHPAVLEELNLCYHRIANQQSYPLFVAEIPLLFEVGGKSYYPYDYSVAVIADESLCKARFLASGYPINEYERRNQQQMSSKEKAKSADFVIVNNGSFRHLQTEVERIFNLISTKHSNEESIT